MRHSRFGVHPPSFQITFSVSAVTNSWAAHWLCLSNTTKSSVAVMCHTVALIFFFIFCHQWGNETARIAVLCTPWRPQYTCHWIQPVKSCGFLQKVAVVRTSNFWIKQFLCSELYNSYLIVLLGPPLQGLKRLSIKSGLQVPRNLGKVTWFWTEIFFGFSEVLHGEWI